MATDGVLLAPDLAARQRGVQRQQKLADMLLQQGLQGVDQPTQTIGRVAIRNSPLQGLSSILAAALGSKMGRDTDAQMSAIEQERQAGGGEDEDESHHDGDAVEVPLRGG